METLICILVIFGIALLGQLWHMSTSTDTNTSKLRLELNNIKTQLDNIENKVLPNINLIATRADVRVSKNIEEIIQLKNSIEKLNDGVDLSILEMAIKKLSDKITIDDLHKQIQQVCEITNELKTVNNNIHKHLGLRDPDKE